MRVTHFATLGALVAAAGMATAQPPAPPPSPSNPLVAPTPVEQPPTLPPTGTPPPATPGPTTTPPPVTPTTPATPYGTPATPPAKEAVTPLPAPTQVNPTWTPPANHASPVAAWSGLNGMHTEGPFATLAQAYNQPMRGPEVWGGVEYLLWTVKPGPIAVPLVNTTIVPENLANSVAAGGVDDRLARTVLGNQNIDFGAASGVRFYAGKWFDACQETGFESSFFFLPRMTHDFTATGGTGALGQPALTVPFNSVGPGPVVGETSAAIAGPFAGATIVGSVTERMTTELWGGDTDMLFNLWKCEFTRIDAIAGFKFLDLDETLDFNTAVLTAPFGSTSDSFRTTNRFYGADIGSRVTFQWDRLGLELTGKVGLGDTVQTLDIRGASVTPTTFGGTPAPGGFFALASNIGKSDHSRFSVVPQVNGKISYDVNCHVNLYVGYDFLYWTQVIRPGDQIDRNINPNLSPVFGGSAAGAGAQLPARLNRQTDYWAQGVTFGAGLKW